MLMHEKTCVIPILSHGWPKWSLPWYKPQFLLLFNFVRARFTLQFVFHFCVLPYYLRHFTIVALAKAGLVMGPNRLSVHNTFGVPSLCNLKLKKFSFLFIQTLHNNCSHIENVHQLSCAHLMNTFFFFGGGGGGS